MSNITIKHQGENYTSKSIVFSGGEIQVSLDDAAHFKNLHFYTPHVVARLQSTQDIIELMMVNNILDNAFVKNKTLEIPYFPYARQDRIMRENEAFSLRPICQLINSMGFSQVKIYDPHSDVTPALLNNVEVVEQYQVFSGIPIFKPLDDVAIIAPDAGAMKKAFKIAKLYGKPLFCATKHRDVTTGNITRTSIGLGSPHKCPKEAIIVDDICDGGRTFIELAKVLRAKGYSKISLFVTHGIFSQGLKVFEGIIDEIYTTNTFLPKPGFNDGDKDGKLKINILNIIQ